MNDDGGRECKRKVFHGAIKMNKQLQHHALTIEITGMDKQEDKWTGREANRWTGEQADRQTGGQVNRQTEQADWTGRLDRQTGQADWTGQKDLILSQADNLTKKYPSF